MTCYYDVNFLGGNPFPDDRLSISYGHTSVNSKVRQEFITKDLKMPTNILKFEWIHTNQRWLFLHGITYRCMGSLNASPAVTLVSL